MALDESWDKRVWKPTRRRKLCMCIRGVSFEIFRGGLFERDQKLMVFFFLPSPSLCMTLFFFSVAVGISMESVPVSNSMIYVMLLATIASYFRSGCMDLG